MSFFSNVVFRQTYRFLEDVYFQRNSNVLTIKPINKRLVKNFLMFAKSFASEPRRRGPLMVVDEPPVDTSKYSNVLVKLNGYDLAIVSSYYHFVDQAARNLNFTVSKIFNLKTEGVNVTLANPPHFFRERNMQYYFKNHGRMIQIESIPSEKIDIFLRYIHNNIPAGVSVGIELKKWEDFVSPPSERNTSTESSWSGKRG